MKKLKLSGTYRTINLGKNSKTVILFDTECSIQFNHYRNGTICMDAINVATGDNWYTCTVNWEENFQGKDYSKQCAFPAVVIKNYSENEGMIQELLNAKVIQVGGAYLAGSGGKVELRLLTDEWQQEYNRLTDED